MLCARFILLRGFFCCVFFALTMALGNPATVPQQAQEAQPAASPQPTYPQNCAVIAAFEASTTWDVVDPELFSAKTAAVVGFAPNVSGGVRGFMRDFLTGGSSPTAAEAKSHAETGIKKIRRYKLVEDPEKADLVVYAFMWKEWSEVASQLTIVKRDSPDACDPQVLFGRRLHRWPAQLLYDLDNEMNKAEAAKPRAAEIWPRQMQEARKKLEKGKYNDAVWEARKAINTAELGFGPGDQRVVTSLKMLITIYEKEGSYTYRDSVSAYKRMVAAAEEPSSAEHANLATYLDGYAKALRTHGREAEARAAETRAATIRQRS